MSNDFPARPNHTIWGDCHKGLLGGCTHADRDWAAIAEEEIKSLQARLKLADKLANDLDVAFTDEGYDMTQFDALAAYRGNE